MSETTRIPRSIGGEGPSPEQLMRLIEELAGEYRSFVLGFLELLDGLDRWQEAAAGDTAERLDLLRRKAMTHLIQHGVRPTAREGQQLDLQFHEVVGTEPDPEREPDTVLNVVQMGYEFRRVVLRPAKVVVAQGGVG